MKPSYVLILLFALSFSISVQAKEILSCDTAYEYKEASVVTVIYTFYKKGKINYEEQTYLDSEGKLLYHLLRCKCIFRELDNRKCKIKQQRLTRLGEKYGYEKMSRKSGGSRYD